MTVFRSLALALPDSEASPYIGRFAPSPTGPLHFGSLLAAVASYLDARAHHGQWLLRIEDLDPPREDPDSVTHILTTLDRFGLHWDGEVRYQSQRGEAYAEMLELLASQAQAFPCTCSRKQLGSGLHAGICDPDPTQQPAWRFLCGHGTVSHQDRLQGWQHFSLEQEIGDFVIRRRDSLWSYQLAVVCDDIDQGVNHIVRGIDLIDSTPRQLLLYQASGAAMPVYAHIPVAVEGNGQKLSKQNFARALSSKQPENSLWLALHWLQQMPPAELKPAPVHEQLAWAVAHWHPQPLAGLTSMPAPGQFRQEQT